MNHLRQSCRDVLSAVMILLAATPAAADRPNILLILADDVGRELLTCYGGESYQTPNLDRMAREGLRFETCYATPLCAPTRVAILTGRYSFRNYTTWFEIDPEEITFAQILRDSGYATAISGKWQLRGWKYDPPGIFNAGFEDYFSYRSESVSKQSKAGDGNRLWRGTMRINGSHRRLAEYGPDERLAFLQAFMKRSADADEPFLAYYTMTSMHRPFFPTSKHSQAPARGEMPPTEWLGMRGEAEHFVPQLSYTDEIVGRLMDDLDALGIADDTVVIFTADNGTDNRGEVGDIRSRYLGTEVMGGKYFPTELGVNVPLLVRWPGTVEAGRISDALVDLTDIFPTLCELAGTELPENVPLDGRSLVTIFRGEDQPSPKSFIWSWGNFEQNSLKYKTPQRYADEMLDVVRNQRWKLYSDGRLFDLTADFLEQSPVAAGSSEEADAARKSLSDSLDGLRASEPKEW